MSDEEIKSGTRWNEEIAKALDRTDFGIVIKAQVDKARKKSPGPRGPQRTSHDMLEELVERVRRIDRQPRRPVITRPREPIHSELMSSAELDQALRLDESQGILDEKIGTSWRRHPKRADDDTTEE